MRSIIATTAMVLALAGSTVAHSHANAHARMHARRDWQADYAAKLAANPEPWQAEFAKTYGKTEPTGTPTNPERVPLTYKTFKKAGKKQGKKQVHKADTQEADTIYDDSSDDAIPPGTTPAPVYGGNGGGNGGGGGGGAVKGGPAPDGGEGALTIHIENRMGRPLSMLYVSNAGAPAAIGNPQPSTTLGTAEPTGITFPLNWAGQITLGDDYHACGSKLEGSNTPPQIGFIDVSYVDGYSVPIVCSCGDKPNEPVTGCNVELDVQNNCPASDKEGKVCKNPIITNEWGPTPPFFERCSAAAYTFSKDDAATCGCPNTREFNCCVGTSCPERSKATLTGGACQGSLKKRVATPLR